MRPKCSNCGLEDRETKKCGKMLMPGEFPINSQAKELLMTTNLGGFCEYHTLAEGMKGKIDYFITEMDLTLWQA